jgi:hypothetical protein
MVETKAEDRHGQVACENLSPTLVASGKVCQLDLLDFCLVKIKSNLTLMILYSFRV